MPEYTEPPDQVLAHPSCPTNEFVRQIVNAKLSDVVGLVNKRLLLTPLLRANVYPVPFEQVAVTVPMTCVVDFQPISLVAVGVTSPKSIFDAVIWQKLFNVAVALVAPVISANAEAEEINPHTINRADIILFIFSPLE